MFRNNTKFEFQGSNGSFCLSIRFSRRKVNDLLAVVQVHALNYRKAQTNNARTLRENGGYKALFLAACQSSSISERVMSVRGLGACCSMNSKRDLNFLFVFSRAVSGSTPMKRA